MGNLKIYLPIWMELLVFVGDNEGFYAEQISRKTGITSTTINHYSVEMTIKGYVRTQHDINKRTKNLYLTEEGHKIKQKIKDIIASANPKRLKPRKYGVNIIWP